MNEDKPLLPNIKDRGLFPNFGNFLNNLQKLQAFRLQSGGLMVTSRKPPQKASTHNHSQKSSKTRRKMAAQSRKINRK